MNVSDANANGQAKRRRLLIVRWGRANINDYVLAKLLAGAGFDVEIAILNLPNARDYSLSVEIEATERKEFVVHEFGLSAAERLLTRLEGLTRRLTDWSIPRLFIGFIAPSRLRDLIESRKYDGVIAIEHHGLYWASRAIPHRLDLLTYYNLEVLLADEGPHHRQMLALLEHEQRLLSSGRLRLVIQDRDRELALLKAANNGRMADRVCRLPLPVVGKRFEHRGPNIFRERLELPKHSKIILYFGAVYAERQLNEVIDVFRNIPAGQYALVLHGSPGLNDLVDRNSPNVFVNQGFVPLAELNQLIGSCDIGIALYDRSISNTRHTAFSSEKVTRYLQCGKPFIAFRSESYERLRRTYCCCELIETIDDIPQAIALITADYQKYSEEAYRAFESEYCEDIAVPTLAAFFAG